MKKYHLSVLIPFLNEEESIPFLLDSLNHFFSHYGKPVEVIFVNDGSTDGSENLLLRSSLTFNAKLISLSKNFGSHAALRAGILHAEGEMVTFMYADLQDPLDLIYQMSSVMEQGSDIVWASRLSSERPLSEKIFSKIYAALMKRFAIPAFPESGFDVVMFNSKVAVELNKNPEANSSIFLQILSLGFRQVSVEYHKESRKAGKSKWSFGMKMKMFIDSFVAFSYFPIRLVTFTGIILFIFGLGWTVYVIIRELLYDNLQQGWPALVSILATGFGITNISLGIIAEYLWRTLDAARKRPVYIIDKITEINNE